MNYIVIDLEWNQKLYRGRTRSIGEIIEIGAVKLDENKNIMGDLSLIVKPSVYSWIHPHVREIVNLSENQLNGGLLFEEAARRFLEFCGDDFALMSWGDEDAFILMQNLAYYGMDLSPASRHYDLQKVYNQQLESEGIPQRGLAYCVEKLGIAPVEGEYHTAHTDAMYAAMIFKLLDTNKMKEINSGLFRPTSKQEHAYIAEFKSLTDPREGFPVCPKCGRRVKRACDIFSFSGNNIIVVSRCDDDGYFSQIFSYRPKPKSAMKPEKKSSRAPASAARR